MAMGKLGARGGFGRSGAALGRAGGSASLPALALDAKIAYFGDSNTEFGLSLTSPTAGHDIRAPSTWLMTAIGATLYEPNSTTTSVTPTRGGNLGHGGDTAANVAARVADLGATGAKTVLIACGTNDRIGSVTEAATETAWATIHTYCRANGIRMVQLTTPPGNGTAAFTAPNEAIRVATNTWLKARAASDLLVIDLEAGGVTASDMLTDQVHYLNSGGKKAGYLAGAAMTAAGWIPATAASTLWTDASSFTANLALAGTGGGHIGAETGNVPNGMFTDATTAGSGATLASSKDTDDKPILVVGGSKTGVTRYVELFENQTTDLPTTGDIVEGFIDFEILSTLTNIVSIDLVCQVETSGFADILRLDSGGAGNQMAYPLGTGRYQARTPACQIPAGAIGRVITRARILLLDGSVSVSGTVKIYKMALRKVT